MLRALRRLHRWSLLSVLAWGAPIDAHGEAGRAPPPPPLADPPNVGYWAAAGLEFFAARAVHPYLRIDGGIPITRGVALQVSALVAEGVRDFYDWTRPDHDWTAAALVPAVLIEKVVYEKDGHRVMIGADTGFGVHVLRAIRPESGEQISVGGLGRASMALRLIASTGLVMQLAPVGVGLLVESEQVHYWYEGSLLFGFRWP